MTMVKYCGFRENYPDLQESKQGLKTPGRNRRASVASQADTNSQSKYLFAHGPATKRLKPTSPAMISSNILKKNEHGPASLGKPLAQFPATLDGTDFQKKQRSPSLSNAQTGSPYSPTSNQSASRTHAHKSKLRNISKIQYADHEISCWYYSAYPVFSSLRSTSSVDGYFIEKLYICKKTFKYMRKPRTYERHLKKVESMTEPPCDVKIVYRQNRPERRKTIQVYRIDGQASTRNKLYCQNLCLFSKLFIEHKNTSYDPEPFIFYVLLERSLMEDGSPGVDFTPVGYFSREKKSENNLSCILIFPPYQKLGYGRFVISLSYEISKRNGLIGSPEKPLSDLGKIGYRSFWSYKILSLLQKSYEKSSVGLSLREMSVETAMKAEDILSTFAYLGFIHSTKAGLAVFINRQAIGQKLKKYLEKDYGKQLCDPMLLTL